MGESAFEFKALNLLILVIMLIVVVHLIRQYTSGDGDENEKSVKKTTAENFIKLTETQKLVTSTISASTEQTRL